MQILLFICLFGFFFKNLNLNLNFKSFKTKTYLKIKIKRLFPFLFFLNHPLFLFSFVTTLILSHPPTFSHSLTFSHSPTFSPSLYPTSLSRKQSTLPYKKRREDSFWEDFLNFRVHVKRKSFHMFVVWEEIERSRKKPFALI